MNTIKESVKKILNKYLKNTKIEDRESLYEKGIDSMTILLILHDIEINYKIKIPDDELLISNFESIEQIVKLVYKLKGENNE